MKSTVPLLVTLCWVLPALGDTILGTKHDLSVAGPGPIRAVTETEVCLFCHAPHRGTGETPLWNHALSSGNYTRYQSSTARAVIGQPTGSSKLCLSCHDGTVALGMVANRASSIAMRDGVGTMPMGRSNLGTDLSDDHPVSFVYNNALVAADGQLKDPATLTDRVRLDHDHQMQCTSCHNPHNNQYGKFLVQDNTASAICVNCHSPTLWQDSVHRTSNRTWNGAGVNPWPHTTAKTVSANACENCHAPHTAGTPERLLNFSDEEQNCYACHSGNVALKNIRAEFNKFSIHPILQTLRVHDPMEDPLNGPRHVECVDCHNPHAAKSAPAAAPNASGALAGVKGINSSGASVDPVAREYELCFRCHADSLSRGRAYVNRQWVQTNTRLEFAPGNASYHPVVSMGQSSTVPSLLAPYTTGSQIYCTDCHNNDQGTLAGGTGPNGPHGSAFAPILERQLILTDGQAENPANFALCYKCHSRDSILADQSFRTTDGHGHNFHITNVKAKAACTTCHDPHGVATAKHLINFNVDYVSMSSNGRREYLSTGSGSGVCSLTCHGHDHNASSYPRISIKPLSQSSAIQR